MPVGADDNVKKVIWCKINEVNREILAGKSTKQRIVAGVKKVSFKQTDPFFKGLIDNDCLIKVKYR